MRWPIRMLRICRPNSRETLVDKFRAFWLVKALSTCCNAWCRPIVNRLNCHHAKPQIYLNAMWIVLKLLRWTNVHVTHKQILSCNGEQFQDIWMGTKKSLLGRDWNLRLLDYRTSDLPTDLSSPMLAVSLLVKYLCSCDSEKPWFLQTVTQTKIVD